MTREQKQEYEPCKALKDAIRHLEGRKFRLDCGHHVTFNHCLANDITIINGKQLRIICSLCGH